MILVALIVVWMHLTVPTAEACNLTTTEQRFSENEKADTCLDRLSDDDSLQLADFKDNHPPFLNLINGSLCLNRTLDLDGDQALCDLVALDKAYYWNLFFSCANDQGGSIFLYIDPTDDFPPQFKQDVFSVNIQEMTSVDTTIPWFSRGDLTDPDCDSNVQPGFNTRFRIEGGNTDDSFRLNTELSGSLVVNRLLDYEGGETQRHFDLNISIADSGTPNRKTYTRLNVTVLNINDSIPVFADTPYHLHVLEEDSTSMVQWLMSVPPVSIIDPDLDVPDMNSLVLSLYNSSDESKVKINGSGAFQMQTTFDREQTQEFTVVLKVHKKSTQWLSSTTTLTVIIDDVNDNRPQFDPSMYHFTISEHPPASSTVGLVYASDLDTGVNAEFNYTLLSHGALFIMETHSGGGGGYGVLRVRNSTLLDREIYPELSVQIGTQEAAGGGGCSGGQCQATVKVTLLDINDNSPVFDQSSYNVTVQDYVANDVLITVHATDDDEGDRGEVIYNVRSFGFGICDDVTINDTSGDVSIANSVREALRCSVLVDACDSPQDPQNRRCTSVPLQVSLLVSNHTVVLYTSIASNQLTPHAQDIQRRLSDILGVSVNLILIATSSTSQGSEVLISAVNTTTQEFLSRQDLQQLADGHSQEIQDLFLSYVSTTTPSTSMGQDDDDDFPPHVIALIAIAAVLLLAFVVAIVVIQRTRKDYKRQQRLMRRLTTATNDIYSNAELGADNFAAATTTTTTTNNNNNNNNRSSTAPAGEGAGYDSINSIGGFSSTNPRLPLIIDDDDNDDVDELRRRRGGGGGTEELGVINPIFQDDDDAEGINNNNNNNDGQHPSSHPSSSLPQLTPRSHTDDGEEIGENEERREGEDTGRGPGSTITTTTTKEHAVHAGRAPDADSGVPSDRENGLEEESDASRDNSPVFSRTICVGPGGGSTTEAGGRGGSVGSAYLAAVLRDLERSTAAAEGGDDDGDSGDDDGDDDDVDMVDVTSSPPAPVIVPPPPLPPSGLSEDVLRNNNNNRDGTSTRGSSSKGMEAPAGNRVSVTRITISGDDDRVETQEVSGTSETPDAASSDPARMLGALIHEHFRSQQKSHPQVGDREHNDEDDEDEKEDALGLGSKLGQLIRPSTPPMHRSRAGDEEEEEVESVPEEPEPDYAKKVRFNAQVVEMQQKGKDDNPDGSSSTAPEDSSQEPPAGKENQLPQAATDKESGGESLSGDQPAADVISDASRGRGGGGEAGERGGWGGGEGGKGEAGSGDSSTLLVRPLRDEGKGSLPPPPPPPPPVAPVAAAAVKERPQDPDVKSRGEELTAL